MADILLHIVAPWLMDISAGVLRADVGHEILIVEGAAVLLVVNHPLVDRHGVIRIISVFRAEAGALRAAAPAALMWIIVERGLVPLMPSGVVGATSPGVAARVAASPRHHAAGRRSASAAPATTATLRTARRQW